LVNSRLSLFSAAPSRKNRPMAALTLPGHPFSRSYGVNLPSSLTEDRSSTLGRLPLPTSVGVRYGLLMRDQSLRGFSRRPGHDAATIPSSETPGRGCSLGANRICLVRLRSQPTHPVHLVWPALPTVSPLRSHAAGAGLSTCCPSRTLDATSLCLGPD
jgi:hypothetical protein